VKRSPGHAAFLTGAVPGCYKGLLGGSRELPLYEYECPKDGVFEQVRKFSDPPLTACPTCGGPIEKLPSAPAIQFKGTGWYITDYARKSSGEGGDKGGDKESAKESAKESTKESAKDGSSSSSSDKKGSTSETKTSSSASGEKK
jgi:putative FmdB family regulatory protein